MLVTTCAPARRERLLDRPRDVGVERAEHDRPGERRRARLHDERRRSRSGSARLLAPADHLAVALARARGRGGHRRDLEPGVVRQQADELLADRAGGAEHADRDLRCHARLAGEEIGGQPHVELHAAEQVGLADVLLGGVRDPDRAGAELVALAPAGEERQVAGVAHDGRVPARRRRSALVDRQLHRKRHGDTRARPALWIAALSGPVGSTVRIRIWARGLGRQHVRRDPALDEPDVEGRGAEQRIARRAASAGSARWCRAAPRWRSRPSRDRPNARRGPSPFRSTRSEPFCPIDSRFSVGSPLIRKRPRGSRSAATRAPSEPFSSPTRNSSPIRRSPPAASRSAAATIAAARPLASQLPRPWMVSASSDERHVGRHAVDVGREHQRRRLAEGEQVVAPGRDRLAHGAVARAGGARRRADRWPAPPTRSGSRGPPARA